MRWNASELNSVRSYVEDLVADFEEMRPEGVVIYHVAGNLYFKKTIEKDEAPKGRPA